MKEFFVATAISFCGFAFVSSCQTFHNLDLENERHSQLCDRSKITDTLSVEINVVNPLGDCGSGREAVFLRAFPSSLPQSINAFYWIDIEIISGDVEEIAAILVSGGKVDNIDENRGNVLRAELTVLEINEGGGATLTLGQWYSRKLYMPDSSMVSFQVCVQYRDCNNRIRVLELLPRVVVANRKGSISISAIDNSGILEGRK